MSGDQQVQAAPSARIDDLFVREYLYSTQAWDDFDSRALTIKGWTAAGGLAAIVAGLDAKALSLPLVFGAALVIVSLWCLEAQWRLFQHSNLPRILALEEYFSGKRRLDAPFQSHRLSRLDRLAKGRKGWFKELASPLVFVPYLPLVLLLGVIAVGRWGEPDAKVHAGSLTVTLTQAQ